MNQKAYAGHSPNQARDAVIFREATVESISIPALMEKYKLGRTRIEQIIRTGKLRADRERLREQTGL